MTKTFFSETRAKKLVRENSLKNVRVEFLIHPSPASPAANSGWADLALKALTDMSVIDLLRGDQSNDRDQVGENPDQLEPQQSLLIESSHASQSERTEHNLHFQSLFGQSASNFDVNGVNYANVL